MSNLFGSGVADAGAADRFFDQFFECAEDAHALDLAAAFGRIVVEQVEHTPVARAREVLQQVGRGVARPHYFVLISTDKAVRDAEGRNGYQIAQN